jgi:hypothetical protein
MKKMRNGFLQIFNKKWLLLLLGMVDVRAIGLPHNKHKQDSAL